MPHSRVKKWQSQYVLYFTLSSKNAKKSKAEKTQIILVCGTIQGSREKILEEYNRLLLMFP